MHRKLRTLQFTMGLLVCPPKPVMFVPCVFLLALVVHVASTQLQMFLFCSVLFCSSDTILYLISTPQALWPSGPSSSGGTTYMNE